MGPLRRKLTALAFFTTATPAWAEVCDEVRPDWDGTPVTALGEFLYLLQAPVVLVLILGTAMAFRFRSEWGGLVVVVGWSVVTYLITDWGGANQQEVLARAEGCIGSPSLFIAVATALSIGLVLYTAPLPKRHKS